MMISPAPVVACLNSDQASQKLLTAAADLAQELGVPLQVLHVTGPDTEAANRDRFKQNAAYASLLNAELIFIRHHDVAQGITEYLRSRPVAALYMGRYPAKSWRRWFLNDIPSQVALHSENTNLKIIDMDSFTKARSSFAPPIEYLIAFLVVMALTAVLFFIQRFIAEADIIMAYLAAVIVTAYRFNRGPTLFAAFASVAAFDFFFVPPFYTFAVDHEKYLISLVVMAITGFMFSSFSERMKQELRQSSTREAQLRELYRLARSLAAASDEKEIANLAGFHITAITNGDAFFIKQQNDEWLCLNNLSDPPTALLSDQRVSQCLKDQQDIAEAADNGDILRFHPVGRQVPVALVIRLPESPDNSQQNLLQTYVSLIDMAMTRSFLSDQAARALVQAESEQLRNAILSAVSHDLRTPLGTIMGLTSTLLDKDATLNEKVARECLDTIYTVSEQLSQKVTNLLQMSRNLRGKLTPKTELHNPEEFVGATLSKMKHRLEQHHVRIQLDDTLLIPIDLSLMEVVLSNLLDNAVKFSPEHSTITIHGQRNEQDYLLSVGDEGKGLETTQTDRIFEHFQRHQEDISGTGLGLAISKAIIEAHQGSLAAGNAGSGGALFTIRIPLNAEPGHGKVS